MTKPKKKTSKRRDPNIYPKGWDHKRVSELAAYYDARKDEDVLGDDAAEQPSVWVEVPQELLPKVRKLLAQYAASA